MTEPPSGIIIIDSGETISPGIVSSKKTTSDEKKEKQALVIPPS